MAKDHNPSAIAKTCPGNPLTIELWPPEGRRDPEGLRDGAEELLPLSEPRLVLSPGGLLDP